MSKKILIISQHFYPEIGSAGNRMKNIFQLLTEKQHDVSILTAEPAYPNRHIYDSPTFWDEEVLNTSSKSIRRIKLSNRKYSRNIFNRLFFFIEVAAKLLKEVIKDRNHYDVVYVTSPPIFIGIVGLFSKFRFKSKFILDIRDLWPESLKGVGVFDYKLILNFFGFIEKQLYRHADAIVVNSNGFIDYIHQKSKVDKDKITFIPNAARQFELASQPNPVDEEKFKVIYTGNVGLAQDITFLKSLVKKLNENNILLTIISYGVKNNELKQFIQEEKLSNVTLCAPFTREKCLEEIRKHQVGIVSLNDKEVFDTVLPGKVVDYMTCEIPIVGSVSGYTKEVLENNGVGLVSETRDVDEIFEHILHLKNHPEVRSKMSKNSRQCIQEGYVWEDNIERLSQVIQKIVQ